MGVVVEAQRVEGVAQAEAELLVVVTGPVGRGGESFTVRSWSFSIRVSVSRIPRGLLLQVGASCRSRRQSQEVASQMGGEGDPLDAVMVAPRCTASI